VSKKLIAQASKSPSIRGKSAGPRRAGGISLVALLLLVCLAYGIYFLVFKAGGTAGKSKAEATGPVELRVVIYTKPSCEPCDRAKVWMTQRKVAFEERDVQASALYEEELKNLKSRIVPVIVVNGEPLYGFQS